MEVQHLLDKLELDEEERQKEEVMLRKEQLMKSTKSKTGKCWCCCLKKCKKTKDMPIQ